MKPDKTRNYAKQDSTKGAAKDVRSGTGARKPTSRGGRKTPGARSPRVSADWKRFEARLAEQLPALAADQYLILSVAGMHRFVQFAQQGAWGVRVETVSNGYLASHELLTEADEIALRRLGWQEPTITPVGYGTDTEDVDGSPNWFVDVPAPVDYAAVAALAVKTFTRVYALRHPSLLQYTAFASDGPMILLPGLGIPVEPPPLPQAAEDPRPLAEIVETACQAVADDDVRRADDVFVLEVDGIPMRVSPEPEHGVVRIVCRLMPVDEIGGNLFELMNRLNATYLAFGYVYVRDGDVRWATELVDEPFSPMALVESLQKGAGIVHGLLRVAGDE